MTYPWAWEAKPTKGYIAKEAPSWAFNRPERVYRRGGQTQLREGSTETDVFEEKLQKETEGKIPPQILRKRRPRGSENRPEGASIRTRCSLLTYPWAWEAGDSKNRRKGASLRNRRPLLTYPWAWEAKATKGYVAKEAPPWAFLNPERVYRHGGQNQLCEKSTETDVFQKKLQKETEGKILAQISGRRRARGSEN